MEFIDAVGAATCRTVVQVLASRLCSHNRAIRRLELCGGHLSADRGARSRPACACRSAIFLRPDRIALYSAMLAVVLFAFRIGSIRPARGAFGGFSFICQLGGYCFVDVREVRRAHIVVRRLNYTSPRHGF